MRAIIFLSFCILSISGTTGQVLEKFSFSKCLSESESDSTKIDSIIQTDNLWEIHLTAYANCIGNFEGKIVISNDTLDLRHAIKLTRTVNKKTGEVEEFFEKNMCDCLFKFVYTIQGVTSLSKNRIRINGETVDEINKRIPVQEPIQEAINTDPNWSSDDIFNIVEFSAKFPGGIHKFKEYISKNLIYPEKELRKGISGKVFLEFVINKDGSIDDTTIRVLRGLTKSCNLEAIRLLKDCPDWIPARMYGEVVKQRFVFPVEFKISKAIPDP